MNLHPALAYEDMESMSFSSKINELWTLLLMTSSCPRASAPLQAGLTSCPSALPRCHLLTQSSMLTPHTSSVHVWNTDGSACCLTDQSGPRVASCLDAQALSTFWAKEGASRWWRDDPGSPPPAETSLDWGLTELRSNQTDPKSLFLSSVKFVFPADAPKAGLKGRSDELWAAHRLCWQAPQSRQEQCSKVMTT